MYNLFKKTKNTKRQYFDFIIISRPTQEFIDEMFCQEFEVSKIVARFEKIERNLEEYIDFENLHFAPSDSESDIAKRKHILNKFRRDICYLNRYDFYLEEFQAMTIGEDVNTGFKLYQTRNKEYITTDNHSTTCKIYSSYQSMKALQRLKDYLSDVTYYIKLNYLY